ncbi:PREDICTED: uncharacterized protein LOC108524331 [Rhinopithecus bieti]|uniref:uncharacterized protein LOC108524331 n=1 Tax=Rhinopithecus bieti TaxID=61621 RepID=UPI00083BD9B6|nr:PREDICTED: uncharacterized protein LOC108524331 [Rhinopithecus bieti]
MGQSEDARQVALSPNSQQEKLRLKRGGVLSRFTQEEPNRGPRAGPLLNHRPPWNRRAARSRPDSWHRRRPLSSARVESEDTHTKKAVRRQGDVACTPDWRRTLAWSPPLRLPASSALEDPPPKCPVVPDLPSSPQQRRHGSSYSSLFFSRHACACPGPARRLLGSLLVHSGKCSPNRAQRARSLAPSRPNRPQTTLSCILGSVVPVLGKTPGGDKQGTGCGRSCRTEAQRPGAHRGSHPALT